MGSASAGNGWKAFPNDAKKRKEVAANGRQMEKHPPLINNLDQKYLFLEITAEADGKVVSSSSKAIYTQAL